MGSLWLIGYEKNFEFNAWIYWLKEGYKKEFFGQEIIRCGRVDCLNCSKYFKLLGSNIPTKEHRHSRIHFWDHPIRLSCILLKYELLLGTTIDPQSMVG